MICYDRNNPIDRELERKADDMLDPCFDESKIVKMKKKRKNCEGMVRCFELIYLSLSQIRAINAVYDFKKVLREEMERIYTPVFDYFKKKK